MPFLSPNQQCQSTEGKNITFHGLAYFKLISDHSTDFRNTEFSGKVAHGPWKKWLDFCGNSDHVSVGYGYGGGRVVPCHTGYVLIGVCVVGSVVLAKVCALLSAILFAYIASL